MKVAARGQAVIELLDILLKQYIPADRLLQNYFSTRRYVGSHDRRCIKDTFYQILRYVTELRKLLLTINADINVDGRQLMMAAWHYPYDHQNNGLKSCFPSLDDLFCGNVYAPTMLTDDEQQLSNQLFALLAGTDYKIDPCLPLTLSMSNSIYSKQLLQAFNQPAPVDLRVNSLKTDRAMVLALLQQQGIDAKATPYAPFGIRLDSRVSLTSLDIYKSGHIELQDEGSQLISYLCLAKPGKKILDLCAGRGGKTLQLAALLGDDTTLIATDISAKRLDHCHQRLQRAGITNVMLKSYDQVDQEQYDTIIIDAPCSGSGTWRRHPELKIHLTADRLQHYVTIQAELLQQAATLIPVGGIIVYITCSFLYDENEQQIDRFLATHNNFSVLPADEWPSTIPYAFAHGDYLKLSPHISQTDGFFGVILIKKY